MRLKVARGGDLIVVLAEGEKPQSVSSGAPTSWSVLIGEPANTIVIHASAEAHDTFLSILTDQRSYNFLLSAVAPTRAAYQVRMDYTGPDPTSASPSPTSSIVGGRPRYQMSGNRELRPIAITDDGSKTYIEWSADQAIPAVFALNRLNREETVDGYMREDIFTIDRVYDRLVFRIDRAVTIARRRVERKRR
jgi:type IV secretion system protein VirB9